eukprot:3532917-Amphidinium_carterae.1
MDYTGCAILCDAVSAELRRSVVVTDAKSLFDSLHKESGVKGREPRIVLAASEDTEVMSLLGLGLAGLPTTSTLVTLLPKFGLVAMHHEWLVHIGTRGRGVTGES